MKKQPLRKIRYLLPRGPRRAIAVAEGGARFELEDRGPQEGWSWRAEGADSWAESGFFTLADCIDGLRAHLERLPARPAISVRSA